VNHIVAPYPICHPQPMSALFDRLRLLFDEGHGVELPGLRNDADLAPSEIRPAAVLIAVTDRPEPGVILTHRPDDMRAHPGQVAFPGGKLDPGEDAVQAALREAHEELAIKPSDVRIIGASDRFVTGTGYDVTPVLGLVPPDLVPRTLGSACLLEQVGLVGGEQVELRVDEIAEAAPAEPHASSR